MYLSKYLEFKEHFEVQLKIVFCDEKIQNLGQILMTHSSMIVYPIDKLLKTLAYCDSNNIWFS